MGSEKTDVGSKATSRTSKPIFFWKYSREGLYHLLIKGSILLNLVKLKVGRSWKSFWSHPLLFWEYERLFCDRYPESGHLVFQEEPVMDKRQCSFRPLPYAHIPNRISHIPHRISLLLPSVICPLPSVVCSSPLASSPASRDAPQVYPVKCAAYFTGAQRASCPLLYALCLLCFSGFKKLSRIEIWPIFILYFQIVLDLKI